MSSIHLSRFVVAVTTAFVLAVAGAALSSSPGPALAADEIACNGDHALEAAGYQCSPLLNKGTGAVVGEAFSLISGTTLTIYTNLFGSVSDTGHTEQKICVDDDDNPFAAGTSCLGGTAGSTINNATLVPAPGAGEEAAGKYEYMIEGVQLTETTGTGAGAGLGRYSLYVSTYTYFTLHFNSGQLSIETFFEAPEEPTPTPSPTATATATATSVANTATPTATAMATTAATSTPTSTATATATAATATATATGTTVANTATPIVSTATPTTPPGAATVTPAATPTFVSTVLAVEATRVSESVGVTLPQTGSGGMGGLLGDRLPVLLLAFWLLTLVGIGGTLAARRR